MDLNKVYYGLITVVLILLSAIMVKEIAVNDWNTQADMEWVFVEGVEVTALKYGEDKINNSVGVGVLPGKSGVGIGMGSGESSNKPICYYTVKTDDGGFKTKKIDLLASDCIYYEDSENPRLEIWALVYKGEDVSDLAILMAEKQYRFYVPKEIIQDNFTF